MTDFRLFDLTNSIEHELPRGMTVIGRGADCDIRLITSSVSRKHGQFDLVGDRLTFTDLGSSNGSFVNGQPVTAPLWLKNGDELKLGELRFAVRYSGANAPGADDQEDATELLGASGRVVPDSVPEPWAGAAGLERASGTQMGYFAPPTREEGAQAYRAGKLRLPPLGFTPRLVGLNGDTLGQVFELAGAGGGQAARTWKLGREADHVDLIINHASVSGQHAQIINEGERWKIVNWMSSNGTFVNGNRGLSTYLKSGDVVAMGSVELAFELPGKAPPPADGGDTPRRGGLWGRLFGRG